MAALHDLTAIEQLELLRTRDLRPVELAEHYLARIERLNPALGAFTTVTPDAALARAREVERSVSPASALWGLPSGDKDLWLRAGVRTTYGSRAFDDLVPDRSDEIVLALDAAGAVSLGKTSAPEFGMPSYTETSIGAPASSPWNPSLNAGGSSGGAAVAVAAGMLPFAPGSDGGGSIRIPAAATGLVGLKPSRGRVPALSGLGTVGGLVTAGPIARTVADAALMLDALATPSDWSVGPPTWNGGAYLNAAVRGEGRYTIAVMTTTPWDAVTEIAIDADARAALDLAVAELSALGHGIEEVSLDADEEYPTAFVTAWQGGAAAIRVDEAQFELLEPLTRWLIQRGRALHAGELAEAIRVLGEFERRVIRTFAPFDAVLTPALAMTPRPHGWYDHDDAERNFEQQVQYTPFTSFVNVAGLPAVALPVHHTESGHPMGAQLIGRPGGEHVLLALGAQLERRLQWQLRHPSVW